MGTLLSRYCCDISRQYIQQFPICVSNVLVEFCVQLQHSPTGFFGHRNFEFITQPNNASQSICHRLAWLSGCLYIGCLVCLVSCVDRLISCFVFLSHPVCAFLFVFACSRCCVIVCLLIFFLVCSLSFVSFPQEKVSETLKILPFRSNQNPQPRPCNRIPELSCTVRPCGSLSISSSVAQTLKKI